VRLFRQKNYESFRQKKITHCNYGDGFVQGQGWKYGDGWTLWRPVSSSRHINQGEDGVDTGPKAAHFDRQRVEDGGHRSYGSRAWMVRGPRCPQDAAATRSMMADTRARAAGGVVAVLIG
jgi:hypothetical protein